MVACPALEFVAESVTLPAVIELEPLAPRMALEYGVKPLLPLPTGGACGKRQSTLP